MRRHFRLHFFGLGTRWLNENRVGLATGLFGPAATTRLRNGCFDCHTGSVTNASHMINGKRVKMGRVYHYRRHL